MKIEIHNLSPYIIRLSQIQNVLDLLVEKMFFQHQKIFEASIKTTFFQKSLEKSCFEG